MVTTHRVLAFLVLGTCVVSALAALAAVLAVAWPGSTRLAEPRRRLAWFGGATLMAAVLATHALMTA